MNHNRQLLAIAHPETVGAAAPEVAGAPAAAAHLARHDWLWVMIAVGLGTAALTAASAVCM